MFRNERLEMKVGLFIGIGIFLMFFIVFSISDFMVFEKGYNIKVLFDFVNGIKESAPVRLAGVHVGEVQELEVFYDQEMGRTRVRLDVWIKGDYRVETDTIARINTLGLLGEQYLELTPGTAESFLQDSDEIVGINPINVGEQMENMKGLMADASSFMSSAATLMNNIEEGEGTLGKLLTQDAIYNDLELIFGRLAAGEGTIGKLLVDETVYDNVEEFTTDIKANPWKLLHKTREKKTSRSSRRGTSVSTR